MFKVKIKAAPLVFAGLSWSYLIQPTLWPFPEIPLLKIAVLSAAILLATWLYRRVEIDFEIRRTDAAAFFAYLVSFGILNLRVLSQALGCDELYHSERAVFYLHALARLPDTVCGAARFKHMPVTEVNAYLCIGMMSLAFLAYLAWSSFSKKVKDPAFRYAAYFAVCVALGGALATLQVPAESHAPLRLLPLFASQALFGLQDFSFRLPGILALAVISALVFRLVQDAREEEGWGFPFLVGFSIYMIPTVFHVSALAQPSVWGFAASALLLVLLFRADRTREERFLIFGSLVIGIGSLMRQNVVLIWPVFLLLCVLYRRAIRRWTLILLPLLFVVPYGVTVARVGHPVAQVHVFQRPSDAAEETNPVANVAASLETGAGPEYILKSSSAPWVAFTLIGLTIILLSSSGPILAYPLIGLSGYVLFFSIGKELWGAGRYQAEYIAPVMAFVIIRLALRVHTRRRPALAGLLVALGLYSFFWNVTIPQDVYYDQWSHKRLSTESFFPYREALGFLQRQRGGGKFVILGGVPTYGRMILWLRGFNEEETETYWSSQKMLNDLVGQDITLPKFLAFLHDRDLNGFLVQYGDPREVQHRSPALEATLVELAKRAPAGLGPPSDAFVRQESFIGTAQGAIDVYEKASTRY